jgi:hypothetical protein
MVHIVTTRPEMVNNHTTFHGIVLNPRNERTYHSFRPTTSTRALNFRVSNLDCVELLVTYITPAINPQLLYTLCYVRTIARREGTDRHEVSTSLSCYTSYTDPGIIIDLY